MNEIATPGTAVAPLHRNRAIVFSLFALVLAALSFHGVLDNLASFKIDELTKQNLWLLGVSIAIDAVVSFLQTIEFSFFMSAQIGQALDPINDGVERLTNALLLATGSLILQDILLKITRLLQKWRDFVVTQALAFSAARA